jgi:fructokinase
VNFETENKKVVVFGEVLFDVFPDGSTVLGGAPFNVACHLKGLGAEPILVSRVGKDKLGDLVLLEMGKRGLEIKGMQKDERHPTGKVEVAIDENNEPNYVIKPEAAWDYIQVDPYVEKVLQDRPLFYHGTLAARSEVSEHALGLYLKKKCPVFCDLNLRSPWWTEGKVSGLLSTTDYLKLNLSELKEIASGQKIMDPQDLAREMVSQGGYRQIIVTQGARGAFVVEEKGQVKKRKAPQIETFEDSVGAGDAFSAVMIIANIKGLDTDKALQLAVDFAARICSVKGAVPAGNQVYTDFLLKVEEK